MRGISEYVLSTQYSVSVLKKSIGYTTWFDVVSALISISNMFKSFEEGSRWANGDDIYCPEGEIRTNR